jgi:hypothetical protein
MPFIEPNPSPDAAALAHTAARLLLVLTPTQAAALLDAPPAVAKNTLRDGQRRGLFRAILNPSNRGGSLVYQPTGKAANAAASHAPFSLRSNAPSSSIFRALMRAEIVAEEPRAAWLSHAETATQLAARGIAQRGHAPVLMRADGGSFTAYETILPTEEPDAALMRVARRWLPILDAEDGTPICVQIATSRAAASGVQVALDAAFPGGAAARHLAEIDREILEGGDRFALAAERVAAQRAIEDAGAEDDASLPFLSLHVLPLAV